MKRRSKTPKNRDSSNAWSCCGCSLGSKKVVAIGRLDVRVKCKRSSIALDEVLGMKGNRMSRGVVRSVLSRDLAHYCIPPSSTSSSDAPDAITREISFR